MSLLPQSEAVLCLNSLCEKRFTAQHGKLVRLRVDLVESVATLSLSESDAEVELYDGLCCRGEIAARKERFLEVDRSHKKSLGAVSSLCWR
jgi:hypothetical protein